MKLILTRPEFVAAACSRHGRRTSLPQPRRRGSCQSVITPLTGTARRITWSLRLPSLQQSWPRIEPLALDPLHKSM
jgi:hypothetical protein